MNLSLAFAALAVSLLGGCASFSPDGGFGAVETAAKAHTGKAVLWVRSDEQQASAYNCASDACGCSHRARPRTTRTERCARARAGSTCVRRRF